MASVHIVLPNLANRLGRIQGGASQRAAGAFCDRIDTWRRGALRRGADRRRSHRQLGRDGARRARPQDRRGRHRSERAAQLQRKKRRRRARDLVAAGQYHAVPRFDSNTTKASRDEVGFRQKGYLWLYDAETWPKAASHLELQRALGHPIEALTAAEVTSARARNRSARRNCRRDLLARATDSSIQPAQGALSGALAQRSARSFSTALTSTRSMSARDEVRLECWQSTTRSADEGLDAHDDRGRPGRGGQPDDLLELQCRRGRDNRRRMVADAASSWSGSRITANRFAARFAWSIIARPISSAYGMIVDTSGRVFSQRRRPHPGRLLAARRAARLSFQVRRRAASSWTKSGRACMRG